MRYVRACIGTIVDLASTGQSLILFDKHRFRGRHPLSRQSVKSNSEIFQSIAKKADKNLSANQIGERAAKH